MRIQAERYAKTFVRTELIRAHLPELLDKPLEFVVDQTGMTFVPTLKVDRLEISGREKTLLQSNRFKPTVTFIGSGLLFKPGVRRHVLGNLDNINSANEVVKAEYAAAELEARYGLPVVSFPFVVAENETGLLYLAEPVSKSLHEIARENALNPNGPQMRKVSEGLKIMFETLTMSGWAYITPHQLRDRSDAVLDKLRVFDNPRESDAYPVVKVNNNPYFARTNNLETFARSEGVIVSALNEICPNFYI